MSKKQLAEQRRYDILESDVSKENKPVCNKNNWFKDYCRKYEEVCQSVKKEV